MEECQARSYCKMYKTDKCNNFCGIYSMLKAVYSLSNIPLKYQVSYPLYAAKEDTEAYKKLASYRDNVLEEVELGNGLYIWSSKTGNGKTSWATNIANHYIRKKIKDKQIEGLVLYINVPTYLERIRRSFDEKDNRLEEINEQILNCELVIFDDIGAERPSNWVQEQLYRIINHRDNNMKSSIYTSNVSPDDLQLNLGDRVHSRVLANKEINFKGGDRR